MAVKQFQQFLDDHQLKIKIIESDKPTRTAAEAAEVHQVPVSGIVKSILVNLDGKFILFLVPGDRKLDFGELSHRYNAQLVRMATPDEVKKQTGYSIGGVPPFGHAHTLPVEIEDGFDPNGVVVPAAGAGNAVFKISFHQLQKILQELAVE